MGIILKLINSDPQTFAWAIGLVVAAFIIYLFWILPKFWKINKSIKMVLKRCNEQPITTRKDILELAECGHPALADALEESANRVIHVGSDTKASFLSAPDDLLHFRRIFSKDFNYSLAEAAPNLLVGLGLLMTFFFLTSALSEATVALMGNQNDQKDLLQATRGLLGAAGAKFLTSIAGLGSSIVWTIVFKYQSSKTTHALAEIYQKITKSISVYGHESLSVWQIYLMEKNFSMQRENEETRKLSQKVRHENLIQGLQTLGDTICKSHQETIHHLSSDMAILIEKSTKHNMDSIRNIVLAVVKRFESQTLALHEESQHARQIENEKNATHHDDLLNALCTMSEFIPEATHKNTSPIIEAVGFNIQTALNQLGEKIGTMNQDALNAMLSNFASLIQTATKDEMEQMKMSLLELSERLQSAASSIETGATIAGVALQESGDHLSLKMSETGKLVHVALRSGADNLKTGTDSLVATLHEAGQEWIEQSGLATRALDATLQSSALHFENAGKLFKNNVLDASTVFGDQLKTGAEQLGVSSKKVVLAFDSVGIDLIAHAKSASQELETGAKSSALHFTQAGSQLEMHADHAGDLFLDHVKTSMALIAEGSTAISQSMIEGSQLLKDNVQNAGTVFGDQLKIGAEQLGISSKKVVLAFDSVGTDLIAHAKSASQELETGAQASALHFTQAGSQLEKHADHAGDLFLDHVKTSMALIAEGSTAISQSMIEGSLGLLENSQLASHELNNGTHTFAKNMMDAGAKFKADLTDTVENFNAQLHSGLATQSQSIDEMTHSIHAITSAMASMQTWVQQLEISGQSGFIKAKETMTRLDTLMSGFDTSIARWQTSFDKVSKVTEALQNAAGHLVQISQEQNQSMTTFANAIPSISGVIQQMNETIQKTSKGNTDQILQTESAIKSTKESLTKTVLTIQEGVRQYSEQIALLHRNLDEKIAQAIQKIAGGVDRLTGAIEDLDDSLEKVSTR